MDKSYPYNPHLLHIILLVAAVVFNTGVAASSLFISSDYSPLIIGSIPLIFAILLAAFRKPAWAVYLALIVVLLPIGLLPATIQSNLNRFLTIFVLIVWVVYVIIQRRPIIWTLTSQFMLLFLVWCLLTLFWAPNLTMAKYVLGGYALRFILFLFLIPNLIRTRETLNGLMTILAIAGWVFLVVGLVSLLTHGYEAGTRLQILEGNENTLGGLFPIVVIGVIWLAQRKNIPRNNLWQLLTFLFLLLSFILTALSGSRGSLISWGITMLTLFIWRQTRRWGLVGLLIMLVAATGAPFILTTTIGRFTDLTQDTFLGGREALWQAAWMLIHDNPLLGVGIGNSRYAMMSYVRLFRSVGSYEMVAIHNPVLTIWVDTGLPGLILYLGVLASSIWTFIRQYHRCKQLAEHWLLPYFALVTSTFFGYFATWIKGGGIESSFSYFLVIALLLLPSLQKLKEDPAQLHPEAQLT